MMSNWDIKKLGEVLSIERGGSPRPIKKYLTNSSDGINWIKISDATASEKYIYETKEKITRDGLHKTRVVNEGDFILSNSMSFGRPYIMKTTGCVHDGWLVLKQNGKKLFETEFLYYLLSSPYVFKQFNYLAAGSTVRNLNIALVSSVQVPIPPIPEQKRIVKILDKAFVAIDKAKANAEKNLQNSRELFDSYLNKVFANPGKDWEEKKLGDVCNIIGGGTPAKSTSKYYTGNIPWATVRDMKFDVLATTAFCITEKAIKESSSNLIPRNNVIIATRVGLGKVCILSNDTAINQDLKGILPKKKNGLGASYLFYWFKSISKIIEANGVGATVKGVKIPFIESLKIPFPNLFAQKQIVNNLDEISLDTKKLESIYQQKLADLEELKKSILQEAFDGEI